MLKTSCIQYIFTLIVLTFCRSVLAAGDLIDLGTYQGGNYSWAYGITPGGNYIVGFMNDGDTSNQTRAFMTSNESFSLQNLGTINGGNFSGANGVSADGKIVIGNAQNGVGGQINAMRWSKEQGMISLGIIPGSGRNLSYGYGISADSKVIVGITGQVVGNNLTNRLGYYWTEATGMVSLGTLPGHVESRASAVNANGSVIAGESRNALNVPRAIRWTQNTGMVDLGILNGGTFSYAYGISADGNVIVGAAGDGSAGNRTQAFMWTPGAGMVSLGAIRGPASSIASGVSADGTVVVGTAIDTLDGKQKAFRWHNSIGMRSVEDWLRDNGVLVAEDITLVAQATNADGSIVVGGLRSNRAFVARVSPIGSGLITFEDAYNSLASVTPAPVLAAEISELIFNGIHGHPLINRVEQGKTGFWIAGDLGADHKIRDGIAEVGFSKGIVSQWQGSVGLGKTLRRQKLDFNGQQKFDGIYTLIGFMGELPIQKLWFTFDTFFHYGDLQTHRGYFNAKKLDNSLSISNNFSRASRIRLDGDKLFKIESITFSPYAQYTVNCAKQKSYTEIGGGFPAYFKPKRQKVREVRMGINNEFPIQNKIKLLASFEGVHRFEKAGPPTMGELIGLFDFVVPGKSYKRNWLRAALGAETTIAQGKATIFLNGSTKGEDDRVWIGAQYNKNF